MRETAKTFASMQTATACNSAIQQEDASSQVAVLLCTMQGEAFKGFSLHGAKQNSNLRRSVLLLNGAVTRRSSLHGRKGLGCLSHPRFWGH